MADIRCEWCNRPTGSESRTLMFVSHWYPAREAWLLCRRCQNHAHDRLAELRKEINAELAATKGERYAAHV